MKRIFLSVCALLCVLLLAACGGKEPMEGWYLRAENGAHFVVTDDGEPFRVSDHTKNGDLFDGLESGDRIRISFESPGEGGPWPGVNWVYKCDLLEKGTLGDVPEEALTTMEAHGYDFGRHIHTPAEESLTVESPVSGYCGNTVTTVHLGGQDYSFWGGDSVTLTDILISLAYDPSQVCRCLPEFTVDTEFGSGYGVNLAQSYARCESGQAALTAEQTEAIRGILDRNCG